MASSPSPQLVLSAMRVPNLRWKPTREMQSIVRIVRAYKAWTSDSV